MNWKEMRAKIAESNPVGTNLDPKDPESYVISNVNNDALEVRIKENHKAYKVHLKWSRLEHCFRAINNSHKYNSDIYYKLYGCNDNDDDVYARLIGIVLYGSGLSQYSEESGGV